MEAGRSVCCSVANLGLETNLAKTQVVCADRQLAIRIANGLGAPVLARGMFRGTYLGVDHTMLRARKWMATGSAWTSRARKARARMVRLQVIRRAVGAKAGRLLRSGILPAMLYGSEIVGKAPPKLSRSSDWLPAP